MLVKDNISPERVINAVAKTLTGGKWGCKVLEDQVIQEFTGKLWWWSTELRRTINVALYWPIAEPSTIYIDVLICVDYGCMWDEVKILYLHHFCTELTKKNTQPFSESETSSQTCFLKYNNCFQVNDFFVSHWLTVPDSIAWNNNGQNCNDRSMKGTYR